MRTSARSSPLLLAARHADVVDHRQARATEPPLHRTKYHRSVRAHLSIAGLVVFVGCGRLDFDPGDADLIAWYPLDSVGGGVAIDATGHGHSGTCNDAATCPRVVPGRHGNAMQFDGVDDVLVVAPSPAFNTSAFTMTLWARLDTPPPNTGCLVGKIYGTATDNSWQLCINSPNNKLEFASNSETLSVPGVMPTGSWHHVAIRWDGITKTLSFDGADLVSAAEAITFDAGAITIGADLDAGSQVAPIAATLDDIRVYGRALEPAEITSLATAP